MGSDSLHITHSKERQKRKENILKQKSSNWLIVCEGIKTEPNYFEKAIEEYNKNMDSDYNLKVKIVGKGMNTTSLIKSTELQVEIDKSANSIIPYGKIFVVFDKDSFSDKEFDEAIKICQKNNYIALWSNQAIEFWFLLHFNYVCSKMDRSEYSKKLAEYFKKSGLNYKYKKNDLTIYNKLCKYGSITDARKYAEKIYKEHQHDKPSEAESCTCVYKFFDAIDERLEELI